MKLLGIDFGLTTIGFSLSEGPLAEPLGQKRYRSLPELIEFLKRICRQEQIDTIVIGLSESDFAQKTKHFGSQLQSATKLPVVYQDENLSSHQAKQRLIEANAPLKKRRQDHGPAATIILQQYLDDHP